ncbi:unnamed protein product [Protopolystoma xenopodis]|uniref:Uncharacterized protein n=1 Tax=Protopolystoma xenopodis TaxID=117903 RepID=A0A448WA71_9PLAT|nr:unnamed protein product [Protopolystoma xenopodis]
MSDTTLVSHFDSNRIAKDAITDKGNTLGPERPITSFGDIETSATNGSPPVCLVELNTSKHFKDQINLIDPDLINVTVDSKPYKESENMLIHEKDSGAAIEPTLVVSSIENIPAIVTDTTPSSSTSPPVIPTSLSLSSLKCALNDDNLGTNCSDKLDSSIDISVSPAREFRDKIQDHIQGTTSPAESARTGDTFPTSTGENISASPPTCHPRENISKMAISITEDKVPDSSLVVFDLHNAF